MLLRILSLLQYTGEEILTLHGHSQTKFVQTIQQEKTSHHKVVKLENGKHTEEKKIREDHGLYYQAWINKTDMRKHSYQSKGFKSGINTNSSTRKGEFCSC